MPTAILEADGLFDLHSPEQLADTEQVHEQLIALMRKTAKRSPLEGMVLVEHFRSPWCAMPST